MKQHEFSLILTAESAEVEAERLYALFDDGYGADAGRRAPDSLPPRGRIAGGGDLERTSERMLWFMYIAHTTSLCTCGRSTRSSCCLCLPLQRL